jgi:hypothetical protein
MKQYGLGLHNYHDVHLMFPGGGSNWNDGPECGWQVKILPFMDQAQLYNMVNWSGNGAQGHGPPGWDVIAPGPGGRQLRFKQVPYAICPSNPDADFRDGNWAQSCYSGSLGSQRTPSCDGNCNTFLNARPANAPSSLLGYDANMGWADHGNTGEARGMSGMFARIGPPIRIAQVLDGTSNTITNPACTNPCNWNYSWGFKSTHAGGLHILAVDGTVRFIKEGIDYNTWQRLGGRAEGQPIGEFN